MSRVSFTGIMKKTNRRFQKHSLNIQCVNAPVLTFHSSLFITKDRDAVPLAINMAKSVHI